MCIRDSTKAGLSTPAARAQGWTDDSAEPTVDVALGSGRSDREIAVVIGAHDAYHLVMGKQAYAVREAIEAILVAPH